MKLLTLLAIMSVFFLDTLLGLGGGIIAMAQVAAETATEVVKAEPGFLDKVLMWLQTLETKGIVAGLAVLVEIVMRMLPTGKPASILYTVANLVKIMAQIFDKLGEIFDKVLPQKTKDQ